jgi:hypothetical protein
MAATLVDQLVESFRQLCDTSVNSLAEAWATQLLRGGVLQQVWSKHVLRLAPLLTRRIGADAFGARHSRGAARESRSAPRCAPAHACSGPASGHVFGCTSFLANAADRGMFPSGAEWGCSGTLTVCAAPGLDAFRVGRHWGEQSAAARRSWWTARSRRVVDHVIVVG